MSLIVSLLISVSLSKDLQVIGSRSAGFSSQGNGLRKGNKSDEDTKRRTQGPHVTQAT